MMIKRELIIKNENETREFGLKLAEELRAGDVLALIGDLGTGKTALTGYIAQGLGISDNIVSPTFTILSLGYGLHLCSNSISSGVDGNLLPPTRYPI